eukprot:TRINITY_DN7488_c0_g1_i5.p1 TRINITY_DN7488_c0_g1~~TRINITY_DN7488_c0_g1_i5.p1  ORF type:complete len:479 (-),score=86.26 TRINITY_DN7488_c0_g1_i5:33-1469(-)
MLLRKRNTPFVVAVNKVDRIYGWESKPWRSIRESEKKQEKHVLLDYDMRVKHIISQLAGQELNAVLYYHNKDFRKNVSLIPTSASTGEGLPDLLLLLIQLSQNMMTSKLLQLSTLQCTVLEVKMTDGFGYTIDVILANGKLHQGDKIVLCGLQGPIVTNIRALLTPQPLKELRVKSQYEQHKTVSAALGLKIAATDLEHAVAGSQLFVVGPNDDIEEIKERAMEEFKNFESAVSKVDKGVHVQASTLGSLEALLNFLTSEQVPVSSFSIGPVRKKDITRASTMLEKAPEYAVLLAFDIKISQEMRLWAEREKVRIFESDIIYQLTEQFQKYISAVRKEVKESAKDAVFPCILRIYPQHIFNKRDPIVVGVKVIDGILKLGTPLCIPSKNELELGSVISIERDKHAVTEAKKGDDVAIKIESKDSAQNLLYGRQFDHQDDLYSKISRESLNALKKYFPEDVSDKETFVLLLKLKKLFGI